MSVAYDPFNSTFSGTPGMVAITSNLTLTAYATLFLTTCLLAHRRKVMRAYQGEGALTNQHLHIVTILLESAVINIPITIATAVGLRSDQAFSYVVGSVVPSSQVCAM